MSKLYTEKQVLNALKLAHSHIKPLQYVIDTLKPIDLPSDEAIKGMAYSYINSDYVELGAKWVIDKIKEANNEQ